MSHVFEAVEQRIVELVGLRGRASPAQHLLRVGLHAPAPRENTLTLAPPRAGRGKARGALIARGDDRKRNTASGMFTHATLYQPSP